MNRPRLFCEFPAGLAAVSLRLQGGAHCRPPISRMGNKAGYSKVILGVLGLHSGQGAGAYWWAEADQDVAALLRIYPDPEALMEVARIIRGWADEEPRALWERLRAERKERGSRSDPGGVAEGMERVAETVILQKWSFSEKGWQHGYGGPGCEVRTAPGGWTTEQRDEAISISRVSGMVTDLRRGWPPVCVSPRIPTAAEVSAAIGTPGDLEGCIVYIDGPYENTTGYGHELPRDEQVKIALDFAGEGATVALSEAEPIPALTGAGWYATEITEGRIGQKRTFSKQKREFVTMNRVPQFEISEQVGLFGGGR